MPRRLPALLLAFTLAMLPAFPARALAAPLVNRNVRDDVFYQIMPIAWRDSDNDASRFGDFGGMTASLPYLRGLGVTAIWMTPIFPSPAYHGYQHGPANQLNPWFGNESQFLAFVNAAHADSIKVFIDFVAYGISQNSVYFTDSHLNPSSVYTDYLSYTDAHVANSQFTGGSYTTWNGGTVGFVNWNMNNNAVTNLLEQWTAHWLDPNGDGDPSDGIDGYRLDHVLANDAWGYGIPWWQRWKLAMQAVNPDVFTFAEQADWGSHGQDLLGAHDATFTKPFEFAARSAIGAGTAAGLYSEMAATLASLPAGRTYLGTLGDHDVDRLVTSLGNSTSKGKVAAAVLMLQPFPPVVYFGDELGMRGAKANYGSDNNDIPFREPFKWNAVAGAPMSNYFVVNAPAYNGRVERDNDGRSVQEEQGVAGSMLETYRSLVFLRRGHAALRHGGYDAIANSSPAVWAFARSAAAEETLLVAINLSNVAVTPSLDLSAFSVTGGSSPVRDVVSGASLATLTDANKGAYAVSIPASGYRVLAARVSAPPPPPPSPYDGANVPTDFAASTLVATQTAPTNLGDNVSELDQMFVRPETGGLAIGITGNLATDGSGLALFFDSVPGGQDSLSAAAMPQPPSGIPQASGLGFDAGFSPDYCLWVNAFSGNLYLDLYSLASGGGGTKRYIGGGTTNNGQSSLSGGANTNGMLAAFDDTNTAGVTAASAAGAASATKGFEAKIPWADIGLAGPGTSVRLMAAILKPDGYIGNQFLPALGPGAADLGYAPVSLKTVPGNQYVTIGSTVAVPPRAIPAAFALSSAPNPFRDTTTLTLSLPQAAPMRVDVLDVSGRRVRLLANGGLAAGEHSLAWDGRDASGTPVRAGVYLVRAISGTLTRSVRVVRIR